MILNGVLSFNCLSCLIKERQKIPKKDLNIKDPYKNHPPPKKVLTFEGGGIFCIRSGSLYASRWESLMKISSEIPNDATLRCSLYLLYTIHVRTYQEPSPVGEGGSRRLTDEVSVSLFALSFGFAQTNGNHLNPCRDRRPRLSVSLFALFFGFAQTNGALSILVGEGLAPPVLCSHYLFAANK